MKQKKNRDFSSLFSEKFVAGALAVVVLLVTALVVVALRTDRASPTGNIREENLSIAPESTAAPTEPPTTAEPSTEPPTQQPTEPVDLDREAAQKLLATMTTEEKLCQMLFVTPETLTGSGYVDIAGDLTQQALAAYPVGGLIYFSQNLQSEEQIVSLISNSQSFSKYPLFIGVDEEGGSVSRLSGVGVTTALSPMAEFGAAGDTAAVREVGENLAEELRAVGFNVDFAPVADVITNPNNTEIGNRSFSANAQVAADMVAAMTNGLQSGGIIACVKHFPGHGSTEADSHYGQSVSLRTAEELRETEFLPFRAGVDAEVGMVMISHMSLPEVTGDYTPCDLSYRVVTELLRGELAYDGVVITDSHQMASILNYYTVGEAAIKAIQAGCDIVLMPNSLTEALSALQQAVEDGTLSQARIDESVLRILTLKARFGLLPE